MFLHELLLNNKIVEHLWNTAQKVVAPVAAVIEPRRYQKWMLVEFYPKLKGLPLLGSYGKNKKNIYF